VTVGGIPLGRLLASEVAQAREALGEMRVEEPAAAVWRELRPEIERRLRAVEEVGLGYLPLSRSAATLSSGEIRRLRLASVLGGPLAGVVYVLDEPTIGLHPDDVEPLLRRLRDLRDAGSSVIVVEHDEAVVRAADWIVELGPGAGQAGGRVVAEGPPAVLARHPEAATARWLRGELEMPRAWPRRTGRGKTLRLLGARTHNLRGVRLEIPLGTLLALAGPSGSGKSSLVLDTLVPALHEVGIPGAARCAERRTWDAVEGSAGIEGVFVADARPLGRTPRATPATYTGLLDEVRDLFARTPEAKARGFGPDRFSPFTRAGRCPECEGRGAIRVEMGFLADVWLPCEECGGCRFREEVLGVRFRGRTIADVLAFEIDAAFEFFAGHPRIRSVLEGLRSLGLGYLRLGQPANALSRGEAQRVRLAAALFSPGRRSRPPRGTEDAERAEPVAGRPGRRLFVLDEPTAGLHAVDLQVLLRLLHSLVDGGDSVVVVEHHPSVLACADRIVELGPGAGPEGGRIVAEGTPEEVAASPVSRTGRHLPGGPPATPASARAGGGT
jgi:excinuclease ABC subunit A